MTGVDHGQDGDNVWSVTCFVVTKSMRGLGLAAELLAAYSGIESTFVAAGFRRVAQTTSRAGGLPRVVVRLKVS